MSFGPTALITPANGVTVLCLLATPVLVAVIAVQGPGWVPFGVALAIGVTDGASEPDCAISRRFSMYCRQSRNALMS